MTTNDRKKDCQGRVLRMQQPQPERPRPGEAVFGSKNKRKKKASGSQGNKASSSVLLMACLTAEGKVPTADDILDWMKHFPEGDPLWQHEDQAD